MLGVGLDPGFRQLQECSARFGRRPLAERADPAEKVGLDRNAARFCGQPRKLLQANPRSPQRLGRPLQPGNLHRCDGLVKLLLCEQERHADLDNLRGRRSRRGLDGGVELRLGFTRSPRRAEQVGLE